MHIPLVMHAGETRVMELESHVGTRIPRDAYWAGMEISYTGKKSALAMTMVSLSDNRKHSIRSVLNWVQSATREGWYWRADADTNTLIGIQNSDVEEAPVIFSLDYYVGQTRHSYEIPLMIPGRASHLVNVGAIIQSGSPDADGDQIPPGVTFGGYRAVKQRPSGAGTLTTEALHVDARRRAFLTVYNTGCCEIAYRVPASMLGFVGQSGTIMTSLEDECDGTLSNPEVVNFQSNNSGVASVQPSGSAAHVDFMGPGHATISINALRWVPWQIDPETGEVSSCKKQLAPVAPCLITVKPLVSTITPARGLIGATTSVTIQGSGFASGATVNAGTGITVTVNSVGISEIQASFNVSTSAPAGNHNVTVTVSGIQSNSVNFFVQVPTFLSIASGDSTTSESECTFVSNGQTQTGCGVSRSFVYQVRDQANQPIEVAGLQVWDEIYTTSPNALNLTSFVTTCPVANTGPCGFATNSQGQFQEHSLSVCAPACRSNNVCVLGGPTNANQIVHVGSHTITQSISYRCNEVTVNGQ